MRARGVAVHAHRRAHLRAQEPPHGDAIDLADDVVQGKVDGAVAAACPAGAGIGQHIRHQGIEVQRVPAEQKGLHGEGRILAARVANFSQPVHVLIGVDADNGVIVVGRDAQGPHAGDLQIARRR